MVPFLHLIRVKTINFLIKLSFFKLYYQSGSCVDGKEEIKIVSSYC